MALAQGECPLSDGSELCEQVKVLATSIPDLRKAQESTAAGLTAINKAQGETHVTLARIEERVAPIPAIADGQMQILQRLSAVEEHAKGQDARVSAVEQKQTTAQFQTLSALAGAVLALLLAMLGMLGKK